MHALIRNWIFQTVFLVFGLFHAINGLRITILDLWPRLLDHSREAIWIEWAVFIPVYGLALFAIVFVVLGYGIYMPAAYAAARQFTTPATASDP
mgnify:CR=1 FL=1